MKQANLILASKEVLGTLRRTAAARIKADGTSASTPHKSTTKYCHLHGPNNSHNGTECKKMGSPGFTISGKAITQAMINNRVPGKVVDGVTGKK